MEASYRELLADVGKTINKKTFDELIDHLTSRTLRYKRLGKTLDIPDGLLEMYGLKGTKAQTIKSTVEIRAAVTKPDNSENNGKISPIAIGLIAGFSVLGAVTIFGMFMTAKWRGEKRNAISENNHIDNPAFVENPCDM